MIRKGTRVKIKNLKAGERYPLGTYNSIVVTVARAKLSGQIGIVLDKRTRNRQPYFYLDISGGTSGLYWTESMVDLVEKVELTLAQTVADVVAELKGEE